MSRRISLLTLRVETFDRVGLPPQCGIDAARSGGDKIGCRAVTGVVFSVDGRAILWTLLRSFSGLCWCKFSTGSRLLADWLAKSGPLFMKKLEMMVHMSDIVFHHAAHRHGSAPVMRPLALECFFRQLP